MTKGKMLYTWKKAEYHHLVAEALEQSDRIRIYQEYYNKLSPHQDVCPDCTFEDIAIEENNDY